MPGWYLFQIVPSLRMRGRTVEKQRAFIAVDCQFTTELLMDFIEAVVELKGGCPCASLSVETRILIEWQTCVRVVQVTEVDDSEMYTRTR